MFSSLAMSLTMAHLPGGMRARCTHARMAYSEEREYITRKAQRGVTLNTILMRDNDDRSIPLALADFSAGEGEVAVQNHFDSGTARQDRIRAASGQNRS